MSTPHIAARAVRAMFESGRYGKLAKDWIDHNKQRREIAALAPADRANGSQWLTSYKALILVKEQCCGVESIHKRDFPCPYSEREIVDAIAEIIPELFGEYWDALSRETQEAHSL